MSDMKKIRENAARALHELGDEMSGIAKKHLTAAAYDGRDYERISHFRGVRLKE